MSSSAARRRRRREAASRQRGEAAEYAGAADFLKSMSGFDGANQSERRGYIYWPTLDTKRELNTWSRTEMLRKSRALRANFGLPNRICSGLADLIGYLTPCSMSGDPKWDAYVDDYWEDRAGEAAVVDAAGQYNVRQLQIELNRTAFGDGDVLPVLVKNSTDGVMLAVYEAHQICNPDREAGAKKDWIDGVLINKFRRHVAYGIKDDAGKVTTVAARDALYYAHPDAMGRIRPPTILAHALNHMQDISEILADTKLTIKVAAQLGFYLKNQVENAGGLEGPRSLSAALRDETIPAGEQPEDAPPAEYKVEDVYRSQGGMVNLPKGTDIGIIQDTRPHPNQINALEFLIRDICWGVGVAPDILWDIAKLGGANSRISNADLDRWIAVRLLRLRSWLKRFRAVWIANEITAGRLPEPAGDGKYWRATFVPQASLTADKGRVGNLNIELVKNRMRSLQTHFAEEGLDWERELRQIAHERKWMRDNGLDAALDDLEKPSAA